MWFSHLRYAAQAAERLGAGLDPLALAWGAICCDVDKVTEVPRAVSHYGHEGLSFPPERFAEVAGLSPTAARSQRSFLAGYLSHLAVDEAWYGHFRELQAGDPALTEGWDSRTMRALNLALDCANRAAALRDGAPDFDAAGGHEVLPHLRGPAAAVMRRVGGAYMRWDGSLGWEPEDPVFAVAIRRFRALATERRQEVARILAALDRAALDERVTAFTAEAISRFLDELGRTR